MNHMISWHQQDPHLTTCVTITIASTELIWNTFVRLLLAITFASTRWFAINIFMANIIFIKHLKFRAEVGVRKRHPTDSYDDTFNGYTADSVTVSLFAFQLLLWQIVRNKNQLTLIVRPACLVHRSMTEGVWQEYERKVCKSITYRV